MVGWLSSSSSSSFLLSLSLPLSLSFLPFFLLSLTRSHYIIQAVLRLTEVSLPLLPQCWDFLLLMRTLSLFLSVLRHEGSQQIPRLKGGLLHLFLPHPVSLADPTHKHNRKWFSYDC